MRRAILAVTLLALVAGPLPAQGIDLQIVKLSDKGEIFVSKTVGENVPYVYTVPVPVQEIVVKDGKEVVVTRFVMETRQALRMVYTKAFTVLTEKESAFTDLKGKDVALADVKKRLEKSPLAVIAMKKDDAPLSELFLDAFKEGTLILRIADPTPKTTAPRIGPMP